MRLYERYNLFLALIFISSCVFVRPAMAQDANFHNAPAASAQQKNPLAAQPAAIAVGAKLYATNCASCHGAHGEGTGNIPPVAKGPTQTAVDGEVFWFVTTGSIGNGMPAWGSLSEEKRWQIVAFLKSLKNSVAGANAASAAAPTDASYTPVVTNAPAPQPPFTDFRYEAPGTVRKITPQELPAPYASSSCE